MVFSSNTFLFLFLPIFLLIYYLSSRKLRSLIIAISSYIFFGWWRLDYLALILLSTVLDYFCGNAIHKAKSEGKKGKSWLLISVISNLALLAYFKYFNFGIDSLNSLLMTVGIENLQVWKVILPIGISFYTFQTMSYTIDIFLKKAKPVDTFTDFMAYVALFPQLIAGPIVRYRSVAEQLRTRTHSLSKFSEGSMRFMVGFCKKVLIADAVAPIANMVFASPDPSAADAWLGALAYTIQLYFDFSGYSDMAIGLGLMLGFRFPENFNHPYISKSITEFWQRWHISLSEWLRDYLYIPLGGNRISPSRTYVNLMTVMLLGGLWHGANWTFVLWGAWHGTILAIERYFGARKLWKAIPAWLAIPRTFILVMIGWVTFRASEEAASLQGALDVYKGMFGFNGIALSDSLSWQITGYQLTLLCIALVLVFVAPWWRSQLSKLPAKRSSALANIHLLILPLFVLAILRLSSQNFSPFLYFQF